MLVWITYFKILLFLIWNDFHLNFNFNVYVKISLRCFHQINDYTADSVLIFKFSLKTVFLPVIFKGFQYIIIVFYHILPRVWHKTAIYNRLLLDDNDDDDDDNLFTFYEVKIQHDLVNVQKIMKRKRYKTRDVKN